MIRTSYLSRGGRAGTISQALRSGEGRTFSESGTFTKNLKFWIGFDESDVLLLASKQNQCWVHLSLDIHRANVRGAENSSSDNLTVDTLTANNCSRVEADRTTSTIS